MWLLGVDFAPPPEGAKVSRKRAGPAAVMKGAANRKSVGVAEGVQTRRSAAPSSSDPSSSSSSGGDDFVAGAAARGRKRKRPAFLPSGDSQEVELPSEFISIEDILTALKHATEMKYEERIDWEDVPGCRNYSLTKKDYNRARTVLMNYGTRKNPAIPPEERKGPMTMPSEENIIDVMGFWSMGLKHLGLKRHGLGVQK